MEIHLDFAHLRVNDRVFEKDVIILYNGGILKRPKDLSRPKSDVYQHTPFSIEEAREVYRLLRGEVDKLIVGRGLNSRMVVEDGVSEFFNSNGIKFEAYSSREAIEKFLKYVKEGEKVALLVHVTC